MGYETPLVAKILVPVGCFLILGGYHVYEFSGSGVSRRGVRALSSRVREGWVDENFLKGQQAVNTTRDYIRVAVFFANTAVVIATFVAGFAIKAYTDCQKEAGGCTEETITLVIKCGVLTILMLSIFFVFTQCSRFVIHFSFLINCRQIHGIPTDTRMVKRFFDHSHRYYSAGIRMYFFIIPVLCWGFSIWALLAVTPFYLFIISGLESTKFIDAELKGYWEAIDLAQVDLAHT